MIPLLIQRLPKLVFKIKITERINIKVERKVKKSDKEGEVNS